MKRLPVGPMSALVQLSAKGQPVDEFATEVSMTPKAMNALVREALTEQEVQDKAALKAAIRDLFNSQRARKEYLVNEIRSADAKRRHAKKELNAIDEAAQIAQDKGDFIPLLKVLGSLPQDFDPNEHVVNG